MNDLPRLASTQNGQETGFSKLRDLPPAESVDKRTVSILRMLLAGAALLIMSIDPSGPPQRVNLAFAVLTCYCLYSLCLYLLNARSKLLIPVRLTHWFDIAWYSLLIALTGGAISIFFFFYLFPILIASFRWGLKEGIRVIGACTTLFIIVGYFTYSSDDAFELNRFLIRPLYLLVFGYMTASWGGHEVVFRRRLALFREINRLSNPRFGIDQTLQMMVDKIRTFYGADCCLLGLDPDGWTAKRIWESHRHSPACSKIDAAELLTFAGSRNGLALVYSGGRGALSGRPRLSVVDVADEPVPDITVDLAEAVQHLGSTSLLSLPIFYRGDHYGTLCLSSRRDKFDRSDIGFMQQLISHILPIVENIRLLDQLASQAADQQRQKISRDIHDSTIQPYIGLKFGLEAIEIKLAAGQPIEDDVRKLILLADTSISELRGYVKSLRSEQREQPGSTLVEAVRQQAAKYAEFYGIEVAVDADGLQINDRLAAEAFQIIVEGLSNARKHTAAHNIVIRIRQRDHALLLEIENDGAETGVRDFSPRSITERAASLGGEAAVSSVAGSTLVKVRIPL